MRRREFIALLCSTTIVGPLAARAQQGQKPPIIGFLGVGTAAGWSPWAAAFAKRLGELGWIEHRTIAIEYRWAEGRNDRYAEIAAEFVRLNVDVIVTGGIAIPALKQATSVIPIVIALGSDPVGSGQVASLARPGSGNITGLSLQYTDLAGKRLELLHEIVPVPPTVSRPGQCRLCRCLFWRRGKFRNWPACLGSMSSHRNGEGRISRLLSRPSRGARRPFILLATPS